MDLENQRPDDHEAKMARADCLKLAKYASKLFQMIEEGDELQGWAQAKITKAADYISSVFHYMEYEKETRAKINKGPKSFEESIHTEIKNALKEQWQNKKQG